MMSWWIIHLSNLKNEDHPNQSHEIELPDVGLLKFEVGIKAAQQTVTQLTLTIVMNVVVPKAAA